MSYTVSAETDGFQVSAVIDDEPFPPGEYVYVIQLDPHLRPNRVKVGCANNVDVRLRQFQTTSPEAVPLLVFAVPKSCELYALTLARHLGNPVANEVFDFDPSMLAIFLWQLSNALHAICLTYWAEGDPERLDWLRIDEWMGKRRKMDDFMREHIKKMATTAAVTTAFRIALTPRSDASLGVADFSRGL